MQQSWYEVIELNLKKILPLLCSVFFLLLIYIPIHIPLSPLFRPDVSMICIYFWVLYRKDLFGILSTVVLGIIADILSSSPDGLNIFTFMLVFTLSSTFGSYVNTKPFIISWVGFAIITLVSLLVKWLLVSIFYSSFLPFNGVITAYFATVFLYPLISRINIYVQNKFLAGEDIIYEQR